MITIKSLAISPGHERDRSLYYGNVGPVGRSYIFTLYQSAVFRDLVPRTTRYRSPYDYLKNGPVMDRHGNKAVRNRQVSGRIGVGFTLRDAPAGPPVSLVEDSRVRYSRIWSAPPTIKLGNETKMITSVSPLKVGGWYRISSYCQADVDYQTTVHVPNKVPICYHIKVSLTWRAATGEIYSHSCYVSNAGLDLSLTAAAYSSQLRRMYGTKVKEGQEVVTVHRLKAIADSLMSVTYSDARSGTGTYPRFVKSVSNNSFTVADTPATAVIEGELCDALGAHTFTAYELSRHAREVIESINDFDSNMLAFASDLKEIGGTIKSALSLIGDYKNPKAWASAWLGARYGDRLTVSDTKELLHAISRAGSDRLFWTKGRDSIEWSGGSSRSSFDYHETHSLTSTVYVSNTQMGDITDVVGNLMKWDVWPSTENVWDMIPLSFVVDWLLPVSDLLSQIDAALERPYLKPYSQYSGEKYTVDFHTAASSSTISLSATLYKRYMRDVIGDVRPFDWAPTLPSFSVEHMLDGVALLVQTV